MAAQGKPVLVLLRGDHQLNQAKLSVVVETGDLRPAHPEEIREWFGADAGSLGPVGVKTMPVIADLALQGRQGMIAGANKNDYHLRNVNPERDFQARYADVREVEDGEACLKCSQPLKRQKSIEVGHIFKLGYKYAESMGLRVLDVNGKETTPIMGSYGIGLERILTAAIEQGNDEGGMILPVAIAPFEVVVTPVNMKDDKQREAAEALYQSCLDLGLDALLDDRQERAGVKFNDADLIGLPYRLTVGKKLSEGLVELSTRSTRQSSDVKLEEAPALVRQRVGEQRLGRSGSVSSS
jgi:prolyl-tRNA synthetase